jgi:uncharacterized protein with HEPN domain
MTRHRDAGRLGNMLDHAREAVGMTRGRKRGDLDADRQLNLSLVRLLEIIGEASARVSDETRQGHPEIPWIEMAGLRNRLIHGYDEVDFDILWRIVQDDLPKLIVQLERIIPVK